MKTKPMIKKEVTAAGGILFRKTTGHAESEIVMIYRWGKWDLPKGKCEKGESITDCARREVSEELGIPLPEIKADLSSTYHEYERNNKLWGKTTHWFVMSSKAEKFQPQTEEEIESARWVPITEAIRIVGYETLQPLLLEINDWLQKA